MRDIHKQRILQAAIREYEESVLFGFSASIPHSINMMEEELYRLLFKTIDELPDKCRNIFLLHLEGKGNEEIALLLNLSILTVKTQKKRAMSYIRERLGRVYFVMMSLGII